MAFQCNICYEEIPECDIITFCNEKHTFCKTCFQNYVNSILEEEEKYQEKEEKEIVCPYCRSDIPYKRYFGFREDEETLVDGKRNGLFRSYYRNGQVKIECNYVNGEINGLHQTWYKSGEKHEECTYVDGKKHGIYQKWLKCGEKWFEITFANDKRKLLQEYDDKGNVIHTMYYVSYDRKTSEIL